MNITVQKMAQAMLDEFGTPAICWGEVAFTAMTILNKANAWVNSDQSPYKIWYGKPPTVKQFTVFGSKCFIKKTDEKLGNFEPRADKGILISYSFRSKGYKCYNKRLWKIVECIDVVIDEACRNPKQTKDDDNEEDSECFLISFLNDIEEETN